ncbi:MAG: sel1 repeat family protein [Hellea sp.]|nr:sel1 repeat family protein [Hellea sp.]
MTFRKLITVAALMGLMACSGKIDDPAARYEQALDAYGAQTYHQAEALLLPIAKQGHADAQFLLAEIYMRGRVGEPDDAEGLFWLSQAAEAGHIRAMSMMGMRYLNGSGVKEDFVKARNLLEKSANANNAKSQLILGFMYTHGKGVEQNEDVAATYYYAAAQQADADAVGRLTAMADNGHGQAMTFLGLMYKDGVGVEQHAQKAAELVLGGAEQNIAMAQYLVSQAYGTGQGFEQDYVKAHLWANLAAAQGYDGAEERRDVWAQLMTPEQIAQAQSEARIWNEKFESTAKE